MKSAVETLNPTRVKLSVEVPFEELKPSVDAAYRKIASQIAVPGFRKGRVPAPIIDQRVGRETVLVEAINDALPSLYAQALQENELTPLSQPDMDLDPLQDGAAVVFRAELDVAPRIELPEYHGLQVQVDDLTVDEATVEQQLAALQQRFASLVVVDRPAAAGDYVTIDLSAARDGQPIAEAQATGMSYQVGGGSLLAGLDEALAGMAAGDEKVFGSTLVAGSHRDQEVDVTVRVTAVKEQELPDLDDEFASMASEFDTLDELRADLRDRAERGARIEQADAARDAVVDTLLGMVDIPLPESLVAAEVAARREALAERLRSVGATEADYLTQSETSESDYLAELEQGVRRNIAVQFVLEEIVRREQPEVTTEEVQYHIVTRASEAGVSPDVYLRHLQEHGSIDDVVAELRRSKALGHLVLSAQVTDRSGRPVELSTLMPDGTYVDLPPEGAPAESVATSTDAAGGLVMAGDYAVLEDES